MANVPTDNGENESIITYDEFPKRFFSENEECKINDEEQSRVPTLEDAVEDFKYGCKEAFDYLYRHYEKKIKYTAARNNNEDFVQELGYVLYKCTQKYQLGGSSCFNTFFWSCARNHIGMYNIKKNSKKRKCPYGEVSINYQSENNNNDKELSNIIKDVSNEEKFENVLFDVVIEKSVLPYLNDKDKFIVLSFLNGCTVKEISKKLHMSPPGIYVRLKKLKNQEIIKDSLLDLKNSMSL